MTKNNKNKSPVLLLLHGTGGSEDDLIPIGKMLCEDCALLSPRGKVTENGMPRFFRRLAEGIFDTENIPIELRSWLILSKMPHVFMDLIRTK